ncbi:MAG TPA: hypothetical protein VKZ44_07845 [Taishania sp.]|nr:hypothetical protein [Taishania sp.]
MKKQLYTQSIFESLDSSEHKQTKYQHSQFDEALKGLGISNTKPKKVKKTKKPVALEV